MRPSRHHRSAQASPAPSAPTTLPNPSQSTFSETNHAFQVIVLSCGGGPLEDDVSGLLVRSVATGWVKNSILAVDAGVHLAAIVRLFDAHIPHAVRHRLEPQNATANTSPVIRPVGADSRVGSMSPPFRSVSTSWPPPGIPGYFSHIGMRSERRAASPAPAFDATRPKLCLTSGPCKDLVLPFESAKANALHFVRHFISTYLLTHAHLDHLSGFAINTASFQHTTRPKKLAALPHTIDAVKAHVFNDILWPNLSDEEGGAGLVSFQRLAQGGNLNLGEGEGRGYIDVCDGLVVKAWPISHGRIAGNSRSTRRDASFSSTERHNSRNSVPPASPDYHRRSFDQSHYAPPAGYGNQPTSGAVGGDSCTVDSTACFIRDEHTGRELLIFGDVEPDSVSTLPRTARVWTDAAPKIVAGTLLAIFIECSYDDSQSDDTLFGHLAPRHLIAELAVLADKVTAVREGRDPFLAGLSTSIFNANTLGRDSHAGPAAHLRSSGAAVPNGFATPTYAGVTASAARNSSRAGTPPMPSPLEPLRRRKRKTLPDASPEDDESHARRSSTVRRRHRQSSVSPATRSPRDPNPPSLAHGDSRTSKPGASASENLTLVSTEIAGVAEVAGPSGPATPISAVRETAPAPAWSPLPETLPLAGLRILITHIKDPMLDGPRPGDLILRQLRDHARAARLGCEIDLAPRGESLWF